MVDGGVGLERYEEACRARKPALVEALCICAEEVATHAYWMQGNDKSGHARSRPRFMDEWWHEGCRAVLLVRRDRRRPVLLPRATRRGYVVLPSDPHSPAPGRCPGARQLPSFQVALPVSCLGPLRQARPPRLDGSRLRRCRRCLRMKEMPGQAAHGKGGCGWPRRPDMRAFLAETA